MTFKNKRIKITRRMLLGLACLAAVAVLLTVATGFSSASAKDTNLNGGLNIQNKTLKLVKVSNPASFKGTNPYPTKALAGQKLLAVTIDFDRDFKDHLRSSETGEVYLSDTTGRVRYYTVDTGIPPAEGPGKKPNRQATFVFSVPSNVASLVFHYGNLKVPVRSNSATQP